MRARILGTASGLPAPDRFGQTVALEAGDGDDAPLCLLDCGDGASSLLMRSGLDHLRIEAVFISHMHADHHGGLAQVVKTSMHLGRREPLVVFAPAEGVEPLRAYLAASYLEEPWLGFPIRWLSLAEGAGRPRREAPAVTLTAFPNNHLSWYRQTSPARTRHTFESYSAVIEAAGRRVVYAGNLDGPGGASELEGFTEPCDLLIAELAHVEPEPLGRFLAARRIGHTVVTHFHPRWNGVPDATIEAAIRDGAGRAGLSGALTLAHDGLCLAF